MLKLNLGSFNWLLPGYVNIDVNPAYNADVVADVRALPYEPNSVDLVYASHILEHLYTDEADAALMHWVTILRPGGILRVSVPELYRLFRYAFGPEGQLQDPNILNIIYGGNGLTKTLANDVEDDRHRGGFVPGQLRQMMETAGLIDIHEWDPFTLEDLRGTHTAPCSPVSENLEGIKP